MPLSPESQHEQKIAAAAAIIPLKDALRLVWDLAAENRLDDTEGDIALEDEQFKQDVALEKVYNFLLELDRR